ncbi:hypothetical protein CDAR_277861, partial [Caerostris darwini]
MLKRGLPTDASYDPHMGGTRKLLADG